jgi:Asp-tRNA(Asn)/Glu-tRNA(Gln) amidotransferase A subunit family amidase
MSAKPTDETELCYLSASEARAMFESRELSPVEYLQAQIARAEQVEPAINAFAFTYFDEALDRAKEAEARFAKRDAPLRPLEGLPCAVKDEMDIAGKPMTNGSLYLKDNVSTETHFSIERLLKAGAIVHARTTTPEFSCAGITASRVHGVTQTPWNEAFTCGGCSPRVAHRSRPAPTSAARFAFRPQPAAWWATSRPTDGTPTTRCSPTTCTVSWAP